MKAPSWWEYLEAKTQRSVPFQMVDWPDVVVSDTEDMTPGQEREIRELIRRAQESE